MPKRRSASRTALPRSIVVVLAGLCGCGDSADSPPVFVEPDVAAADGTQLWTRVYRPDGDGPHPVLISRTPYLRSTERLDSHARMFTRRGYAWVVQASRGTFESAGDFVPYRDEVRDGGDLVSWVAEQKWARSDQVGTAGCSYAGFTALAAAIGNRDVRAVWADGAVADESFAFHGGLVNTNSLSWFHLLDTGDWFSAEQVAAATNSLTPGSLDTTLLGYEHELWQSMIADPVPTSEVFDDHGINRRWSELCAPTLITSVGEDTVFDVVRGVSSSCAAHREHHRYLVSEGRHCTPTGLWASDDDNPVSEAIDVFLERHLLGLDRPAQPQGMLYVEGADRLEPFESLATASDELVLHLDLAGSTLAAAAPTIDAEASLAVDPAGSDPCRDDNRLLYRSAPLEQDLLLVGPVELRLWAASSQRDADFFAIVYLPGADRTLLYGGVRGRYRDGYGTAIELTPDQPSEIIIRGIREGIARVPQGSRIELYVSGAECGYLENPHTFEPIAHQTRRESSTHRFFSGPSHPTQLVLRSLRASTAAMPSAHPHPN